MDAVADIVVVEKDFTAKLRALRSVPKDQLEGHFASLAEELDAYSNKLQDVEAGAAQYYKAKAQAAIAKMRANLAATRRALMPRQRFSFASRKLLKKEEAVEQAAEQIPSMEAAIVVEGLKERYVVDDRGGSAAVHDLTDCVIWLKGAVTALYIERCEGTTIIVDSVGGGARVEFCKRCNFRIACHQLRIHDTTDSIFLSGAKTSPIIERCNGLQICFEKEGFEKVLDFTNPNAEVSPCWKRVDVEPMIKKFNEILLNAKEKEQECITNDENEKHTN